MTALVHAIPETQARTGKPVVVIGGLAVICRVSGPHRATSDLDTVNRRRAGEPSQLQVLVTSTGRASGPAGVLIPTALGEVQVDILEVSDADFDPLPEDPTGRLHVLSHAWAADTATAVLIRAQDGNEIIVAVAEPGPLVAMKLQSTFDRGTDKASTDLLDIIRLTLDRVCGPRARAQLGAAGDQLKSDVEQHVDLFFGKRKAGTLQLVRRVPEGVDTELDDIELVHELLVRAVRGS
ncbi:prevent-host-death protein [Nocardia rhizosphaerihabitans]|nr:prevent-host-death protein [Nocardia rhizosphaerihabitans]